MTTPIQKPADNQHPLNDVTTTGDYDAARGLANTLDAMMLRQQSQSTDPNASDWQQQRHQLRQDLDSTDPNDPPQVARLVERLQETYQALLAQ